MSAAYFDTSALLKLVLEEEGSAEATRLWQGSAWVYTSLLAYPEGRAALAAARRLDRLSHYRTARPAFETLWGGLHVVELTEPLARGAGALAEQYALRGYDAVHLASALALAAASPILVTWDLELAGAGRAAGLATAPSLL